MNRSFVILAVGMLATGCVTAINTSGTSGSATESSLMQADRDFAVATHARGIDGWMSFYTPDAIRIRYRGNMVKGFNEIRKFDLAYISDTTNVLNWEPTDAHVFRGGEIGSTTGRYWAVSRAGANAGKETGRGRYVTMWRREGGRWLVIMDTGYPEPAASAQSTGDCRGQNSWSDNTVSYFTRIVTDGSAGNIKLRQAFNLPEVASAPAVSLVTDGTECGRAVTALNGIYTDGISHGPAYVFRIGTTRFAVADGSLTIHIFDSSYKYLLSLGP